MDAGELRQNIIVNTKNIGAPGDRGQPTVWWLQEAQVRAKIEELSGRKLELARQLVPTASHLVTIRYLSTLKITDQIVWGTRTFAIKAIINKDLLNFTQEIYCTEEVAGA